MKSAALTLLAAIFALSLSACSKGAQGQGGFPPSPVQAEPIVRGDIASTINVTSTVVPLLQASLSSVVSGNVILVSHQIGEQAHQGELLVKIDDSTLLAERAQAAGRLAQLQALYSGGATSTQASLQSAKVANDNAKTNLMRDETLYSQGFVAKSELDLAHDRAAAAESAYRAAVVAAQNASLSDNRQSAALADLRAAQAAVQALDAQIVQTNVSAPFDGTVTARNVDPGTLASPGTVLMQVAKLDPVYVDAGITGSDLQYVHVGSPISITADNAPGRMWHAVITYLNQSSLPGTLTYQARAKVANPDIVLRGGMVVNVSIDRQRKHGVLLAPRGAVFQTDAGYAMFVIDQGKAKFVPIDMGFNNDQQAEVSGEGLKPGVMAIINHSVFLQPGSPVMVMPPGGGPPGAGGGPPAAGGGKGGSPTPAAKRTGAQSTSKPGSSY
ncbi:MAG TPA: efflux RND transporter periplasmic adaptor subunit [Candidatus Eremiobacteraceae bacterium]|jgi:RND family efflux transporter MFP subunit|nr:efflux RND transporter periplasmic adaptor subunit [Candidatus Eremiobacteraceae bacterium]